MKTNGELVKFAKKAFDEKWGYCLGTFGQILTPSLLAQKMKQGYGVGVYNTKHYTYMQTQIGRRVSDCYGLVKAFVWWSGSNPVYNAATDRNQEGAYNKATEKGPLSAMPEIPGLILWMRGHAGIYIGNGEFIECVGAPVGMRKGMIRNGMVIAGSKFTHWFKDTYISYVDLPPKTIRLDIRGKVVNIPGVLKSDVNYIKLGMRELPLIDVLTALGLTVTWDAVTKTVIAK